MVGGGGCGGWGGGCEAPKSAPATRASANVWRSPSKRTVRLPMFEPVSEAGGKSKLPDIVAEDKGTGRFTLLRDEGLVIDHHQREERCWQGLWVWQMWCRAEGGSRAVVGGPTAGRLTNSRSMAVWRGVFDSRSLGDKCRCILLLTSPHTPPIRAGPLTTSPHIRGGAGHQPFCCLKANRGTRNFCAFTPTY
jgi:hypothetical protein